MCWNITAKAQFGGGLGTESSPYEIYTKAHLEELADSVNNSEPYPADNWSKGKFFKVMNDINEPVTKMIGNRNYNFQGNFNGQNYKIKLNIVGLNSFGTALFVYIRGATIFNVIVNGNVKGKGSVGGIVGGIVGEADSSVIFNSVNLANIEGEYHFVGGIIGFIMNNCVVHFCLNLGSVVGEGFCSCVGGVVGHSGNHPYDGTNSNIVSFCKNAGYIKGYQAVSGIVGHLGRHSDNSNTIVFQCFNVGVIEVEIENTNGGITYVD